MAERPGRGEVTVFPLTASEVDAHPEIIRHPDAREKRRNRSGQAAGISKEHITGPFAPRLIEMLDSPAYRVLNLTEHRILARLEIELHRHGRKAEENGNLPCTHKQFVEYGAHPNAVAPAVRAVVALGFVIVTQKGSAGNAEHRQPTLYLLTYRPFSSAKYVLNGWRRIGTIEEAEAVAKAARVKPADTRARTLGRKGALARWAQKQNPAHGIRSDVATETVASNSPVRYGNRSENRPSLATETVAPLRISRGGACPPLGTRPRRQPAHAASQPTPAKLVGSKPAMREATPDASQVRPTVVAETPKAGGAQPPGGQLDGSAAHSSASDGRPSALSARDGSLEARQAEANARKREAVIEARKVGRQTL